jgi:hypothetical protein
MLLPGLLLALVILYLAHLIAPPHLRTPALVITGALFCLDPALLAHTALVKNDVTTALSFSLVTVGLVLLGSGITLRAVAFLLAGVAIGITTKFTALLLGPIVLIVLSLRAVSRAPWHFRGKPLGFPWVAVLALALLCTLVAWASLWTAYGFRHSITPNPSPDSPYLAADENIYRANKAYLSLYRAPTDAEIAAQPLPVTLRASRWAVENHLIPAAYGKGLSFTLATTLLRNAYLLGEVSVTGWWYFFPLCVLFKFPLASLLLLDLALYVGYLHLPKPRRTALSWPLLAVLSVTLLYWLSAITGNFNIGIRHLIPVIPLMHVLTALAAAWAYANLPKLRLAIPALVALLALETLYRFPNYIAFFNLPAQAYGPERLLGDSNLDWGQDLTQLADWQRQHADVPLALAYFGAATPEAYGLRIVPLLGTNYSQAGKSELPPSFQGVVAISASSLQELAFTPSSMGVYSPFRRLTPIQTVGNSIYLYRWPPTLADLSDRPLMLTLRRGNNVTPLTSTGSLRGR